MCQLSIKYDDFALRKKRSVSYLSIVSLCVRLSESDLVSHDPNPLTQEPFDLCTD